MTTGRERQSLAQLPARSRGGRGLPRVCCDAAPGRSAAGADRVRKTRRAGGLGCSHHRDYSNERFFSSRVRGITWLCQYQQRGNRNFPRHHNGLRGPAVPPDPGTILSREGRYTRRHCTRSIATNARGTAPMTTPTDPNAPGATTFSQAPAPGPATPPAADPAAAPAAPVDATTATDPAAPAVSDPATDTSGASAATATDTTAAAAASAATAAATPTPSSPTNTAAAAAASTVGALMHILGDPCADDDDVIEAAKVIIDALDNSSFVGLLNTADSQAATSDC